MINWGAGFFSGIMLGFSLVILAVECYFLILDKASEKELSGLDLAVLIALALLALILIVTRLTVVAIFLLPAGYFFLNFLRSRQDTLQENRQISQRIRSLQEKLARQPHDASACTALGDIFFRQRDYEKALALYQKAYQIDPVPWLAQKVKVAHRENEIQKGNLWLCPECGTRNTGKTDYCCSCGQPRNTILSWKSELKQQRRMLLLGLLAVILIPLFLMVLAGIFKGFSLMAVFVFSCLLVYLIFWKLFSW